MAYVTIAILIISICYIAYKQAPRVFGARRMTKTSDENGRPRSPQQLNSEESTPKATATSGKSDVPTFALSGDVEPDEDRTGVVQPRKAFFPAANSAQRVSDMPPPPRMPAKQTFSQLHNGMPPPPPRSSPTSQASSASLMPPPSMPPPSSRKPAASPAASLRVPSSGPLPNRGPPAHSQQRASGGLTANGVVASTKPRAKVILQPGHSPMDWAALSRSSNLAGVPSLERVTPSQLRAMTGRKGKPAWSVFQGKVYNITPYVPFHPGGEPELLRAAGRDGTALFNEVHPWVNMENMLESCLVGILVSEQHVQSTLEDID